MIIENLNLIDYSEALTIQNQAVSDLIAGKSEEKIIICHHPSVVTMGKKATSDDLCGWKGEVVNIKRGGKATYHGPGQVVAYPIIDIKKRNNDIYWYLRAIETAMVETLKQYGVNSYGNPDSTGVWVDDRKIASIGIAIKRWVTYHGLAINIFSDPVGFSGIKACGMSSSIMTTLSDESKEVVNRTEFENILAKQLENLLKL